MAGEGYQWCVSIDLKSFLDEIPHGLILKLIRRKIAEERMVTLIARSLKAGVIVEGKLEKNEQRSTPKQLSNPNGLAVDRRAAHLSGTSRSVGREWPLRPPPTWIRFFIEKRDDLIRYFLSRIFQINGI